MALLTWAEFCSYDGTDPADTTDQARVEKLIESAKVQIEKYCNRFFEQASRTIETPWRSSHIFKAIPVSSVQVFVDSIGEFLPGSQVTSGFWLNKEDGILAWNLPYSTLAKVKIVYTGGFSSIPEDLKEAVYKTVKWDKSRIFTNQVGLRSTVSGEVTTTFDNAMPYEVRQTLDLYRLP